VPAYVGHAAVCTCKERADHQSAASSAPLSDPANFYIDPSTGKSKLKKHRRPCGRTRGYNSIRETDNVANSHVQLAPNSLDPAVSQVDSCSAFRTLYPSPWTTGPTSATSFQTPITSENLLGTVGLRHAARYDHQLSFMSCHSSRTPQQRAASCWEDGKSAAITQFQTGNPCGIAFNNDYVGVGQDGSMDASTSGLPLRRFQAIVLAASIGP